MTRVLCVCLGNICRSPTAEAVLRARALTADIEVDVDSAGTSDWHIGAPPHPPAIRAAAERGYDLAPLRARQVTANDFHRFDLIVAMDRKNLAKLDRMRPAQGTATLALFLGDAEVPDPYYSGDFDGALDLIEAGAERLLDQLRQNASAV